MALAIGLAAAVAVLPSAARAGQDSVEARVQERIDEGDLDGAERLLKRQAERSPNLFHPHYNLACIASLRGDASVSADHLVQALSRGFGDLRQLRRDEHLQTLRDSEYFEAVLRQWQAILESQQQHRTQLYASLLEVQPERVIKDDAHRLAYLANHDAQTVEEVQGELETLRAWAERTLFPTLSDEDEVQQDAWVLVVMPNKRNFERWLASRFGPGAVAHAGASTIGGSYSRDDGVLVARDLGPSLRHEFVHILHHRDMDRTGRRHPLWVQEGLASLVEDIDWSGDRPTFTINWRTNILERLEGVSRLPSVRRLTEFEDDRFVSRRPLENYAMARGVMLWLESENRLGEFYQALSRGVEGVDGGSAMLATDPTGWRAVVYAALGADGLGLDAEEAEEAVQERYRDWVRTLTRLPDEELRLDASLALPLDMGDGDGLRVLDIPTPADRARTGLRLGAVITHIEGQPVRDLTEYVRRLSDFEPGDAVSVRYRFGEARYEAEATLAKPVDFRMMPGR